MIKVIVGQKGTGKTRTLIEMANQAVKDAKGHLVFIDGGRRRTLGLNHAIRFASTKEFGVKGLVAFCGFLSGIIAENYDIGKIYIDGLQDIIGDDPADIEKFLKDINELSDKFDIRFIITMNGDPDSVPAFLKKYIA